MNCGKKYHVLKRRLQADKGQGMIGQRGYTMTDTTENATSAAELRRKAEEQIASQPTPTGELDAKRLLHELQVHQAELEMQNEELRRVIAEKSEHEAHLLNIIQQTPAGYFHIDREGHILDVNNAWLRMHGYDSKDEVIGRDFSLVQVNSGSHSALAHLAELQRGVAIPYGEFEHRRKDGSVGHHIFSAHPVVRVGNITGFEWFIIDISERKQLEEDKLLLQQQFQQAQKLESLGVLAGGIAHDFNNILAIIMGYCGLTKLDYEQAEKNIPEIEIAVGRAAELCRQMLAYAGKASLSQSQVNMRDIVGELTRMLKATINQNVVINTRLPSDIPWITGDASQLRQVAMNLIINASEAIGEEQGVINVSLACTEIKAGQSAKDHNGQIIPAGQYLCLEVADSGCGMSDEIRQRIFEPFYTTKFTGRGLGMSALLGIIRAHKGALQLESRPGQGTTFKVYLPVKIGAAGEELSQQETLSDWKGSGTILLVEDEPQIRMFARELMQGLGFSVIEAANGKEALELYQQNSADITLVVADMGMPVMDGYEMFRELKKLDPKLPIIISSGFGESDIGSKIPGEAIAGMINKPYNLEHLREVLKGVVEGCQKQA
jgi:PAS domain S-box-containing protein